MTKWGSLSAIHHPLWTFIGAPEVRCRCARSSACNGFVVGVVVQAWRDPHIFVAFCRPHSQMFGSVFGLWFSGSRPAFCFDGLRCPPSPSCFHCGTTMAKKQAPTQQAKRKSGRRKPGAPRGDRKAELDKAKAKRSQAKRELEDGWSSGLRLLVGCNACGHCAIRMFGTLAAHCEGVSCRVVDGRWWSHCPVSPRASVNSRVAIPHFLCGVLHPCCITPDRTTQCSTIVAVCVCVVQLSGKAMLLLVFGNLSGKRSSPLRALAERLRLAALMREHGRSYCVDSLCEVCPSHPAPSPTLSAANSSS